MKKKNNKNILVRFSDEELKMLDEIYNYLNTEENIRITKSFIIRYGIATLYKKIKNNELEERNHKAIEYIKDYLCSYDYTSAELKDIANVFMGLLDTLQGVDK